MTYPVVDMLAAHRAAKRKIDEAQHADAYRDNEAKYDKIVIADLDAVIEASIRHIEKYRQTLTERQAYAQDRLKEMELLIKRSGSALGVAEIELLETNVRNIKKASDWVSRASRELAKAISHFREGNWAEPWSELLDNKGLIAKYEQRATQVMRDDKAYGGRADRITEYVKRAEALLTAARRTAGQASADAAAEAAEFDTYAKSVKRDAGNIETKITRAVGMLKDRLRDGGKADTAEVKRMRGQLADYAQEPKRLRGMLKTLDIRTAAFKRAAAGFTGQARQAAAAALKEAAAARKTAQGAEKAVTKLQADAAKTVDAIIKL